jgi:hypothetical protein
MNLYGGCLCENLRYHIDGEIIDAGYCHCTVCQRSSGAPMVAWLTIPVTNFRYLHGAPSIFRSSEHGRREYCSKCGTQLAFRKIIEPATIDITLCSLEDSSSVRPQYHIWTQSKASWLKIDDGLPQYEDSGPDVE